MRISDWSSDVCSSDLELKGRVDGVAASAATLPLIACDTIEMPENSQIMIHEPTTWAWGTLAELKSSIAMMENIIDSVIAAYVRRSGQSAEKIMEMMEAATRSEEHTSELQSLMRISYAVFCLQNKKVQTHKQRIT